MRILFGLVFVCLAQLASAADEAAALKNYLTDDVVAVAHCDLSAIDPLKVLQWGSSLGLVDTAEHDEAAQFATTAQARLNELVDAGVGRVYLLFRVSDVTNRGTSWVVPVAAGGDANAVLEVLREVTTRKQDVGQPKFWETVDGVVLGATTEKQLEHLKHTRPQTTRDLDDAWAAFGQGDIGLTVFGDDDSRRVVREMFPPLPEPLAALNGELLADGLLWGGFSLKLPPQPDFEIVIQAKDNPTAASVAELITAGLGMIKVLPWEHPTLEAAAQEALINRFAPQVEAARVRIHLSQFASDAQQLAILLNPPFRSARQAAHRAERMNQFKNIALAFHNYANKHDETLPAAASYDAQGKPLLSWRVHLLPYLEQQALYNEFHLDEPWDSEHNLPLSAILPSVFVDPDPALRKLHAEGKTTYVVPASDGTLFDSQQGSTFKEVIDGTSNTVMLVEVVPERAVIWTKPEDWQVDLDHPLRGVKRSDREWFTTAYCDGSARVIENSISEEELRARLTKAGKEVVPYP